MKSIRAITSDPEIARILTDHPEVEYAGGPARHAIEFVQGTWERSLHVADRSVEFRGLVELVDNNPMVCADAFSVPDPASTIARVAVEPLIRAGILAEAPNLFFTFPVDEAALQGWLEDAGWFGGATVIVEPQEMGSVRACSAMAVIQTPANPDDIDALYDEAYGRSFFVRREEDSPWSSELVQGKNEAVYRLRISPGDGQSLLTVQVLADANGKCGAAQAVHAMNIMAGFEESLGLEN